MQINGPTPVSGAQPIQQTHKLHSPQPAAPKPHMTPVDQLDISQEAEAVNRARDVPEIRQELVDRIKGEIEAGTYETADKLEIAVGRLLDELSD